MKHLSRRKFLAASAATVAAPAIGMSAPSVDFDVVIVGAGAAGIAAARRVAVAGRSFRLIEASGRIGGRCITDTTLFGVPFDRGAHTIHFPDTNPLLKLASRAALEIYPVPTTLRLRVGQRHARDSEIEEYLGSLVRANRAISDAARGRNDINGEAALPRDLRDWRPTADFMLGAYGIGKDLRDVSSFDFARSIERDTDAYCRQGYGAVLARLGANVPVTLSAPVTRIDTANRLEVETEKGRIYPRAVIVTASTDLIASGKIKFVPELPKRHLDALNQLKLGSRDHIALEMPGNPLGLERDDLIFEKADGARTAALLANIGGTALATVDVGGRFGRDLARQGEPAMIDFATEWLAGLFGNDARKAIKRTSATRWIEEPWALGASSVASPGGQGARKILMEPVRDRIWFAGEAVHETLWGSVEGAWESGVRAAEAVLRKQGALREPEASKPPAKQPTKPPGKQPAKRPQERPSG